MGATYGDDYTLDYLTEGDMSGYTMLTVYTPKLGVDLDDDDDVDGNDFLAWQRGASPIPLNSFDLYNWQTNFGTVASSDAATSTAVPEPASGLLLMLGITVMLFRRQEVVS